MISGSCLPLRKAIGKSISKVDVGGSYTCEVGIGGMWDSPCWGYLLWGTPRGDDEEDDGGSIGLGSHISIGTKVGVSRYS